MQKKGYLSLIYMLKVLSSDARLPFLLFSFLVSSHDDNDDQWHIIIIYIYVYTLCIASTYSQALDSRVFNLAYIERASTIARKQIKKLSIGNSTSADIHHHPEWMNHSIPPLPVPAISISSSSHLHHCCAWAWWAYVIYVVDHTLTAAGCIG
jgi:hypothetical protein